MGDSILHFLFYEDGLDHKAEIDCLILIQYLGIRGHLVCQDQGRVSERTVYL